MYLEHVSQASEEAHAASVPEAHSSRANQWHVCSGTGTWQNSGDLNSITKHEAIKASPEPKANVLLNLKAGAKAANQLYVDRHEKRC